MQECLNSYRGLKKIAGAEIVMVTLSEEKNAKVVMQADSKRSCGVLAFHNILSLARGGENIL